VSGLEASATEFRLSAGVFRFLRDNFQHAPSVDMQSPVVGLLLKLMQCQARECVVQQTLMKMDNRRQSTPGDDDVMRCVELAQECSTVCNVRPTLT